MDVTDYPGPEHARWAQGPSIAIDTVRVKRIATTTQSVIPALTHPEYDCHTDNWFKWRLTYEGGEPYVEEFLKRFSKRESVTDFRLRKQITPIPSYAKGAINEIKNSIFQRMTDTIRIGGPATYQKSINGNIGGVDLGGAKINWFIGHSIIAELLTMRKVGVFVDMPDPGITLKDKGTKHPYFYVYKAENIRNWHETYINGRKEFDNILLREYEYESDSQTGLPVGYTEKYRHMWLGADGLVHLQFYDQGGQAIGSEETLTISRIPFVVFEISDSLLKDVANAQIALMNLDSSDVSYGLKGNFPFYVEQYDERTDSGLIKQAQEAYQQNVTGVAVIGAACVPAKPNNSPEIEVGATQGRRYPKGMNEPAFIAPPSEPMKVSMEKQRQLKEDIRTQVHLALSNIQPKMASAESKSLDQAGLESGLSYIGLELEHGERQLASLWCMYEGTDQEPTINYPEIWSLKTWDDIKNELEQLLKVREEVPSPTFQREINKRIVDLVLSTDIGLDLVNKVKKEIDNAKGTTANSKTIGQDLDNGIVDLITAAVLRGYPEEVVAQAKIDHAERIARIKQAQEGTAVKTEALAEANNQIKNDAARGVPDLAPDPKVAALEKVGKLQRGAAQ